MKRQWLLIAVLAFAGGLTGLLAGRWLGDAAPGGEPKRIALSRTAEQGEQRPAFELPGLDGNTHHVSQWDGKVLLLNFWATWCAPCREEMPMLDALQAEYGDRGLQIVGVALDSPGAVQAFTEKLGIDYPLLIDDEGGDDLARRYGNTQGVLPYSVLIGRDGNIEAFLYGALEREALVDRLHRHL